MIKIPAYIHKLEPYKPGKSSDPEHFQHYKAILSSNENNYGPSPLAMDAISEAASFLHLYPDPQGEVLCNKLAKKHGVEPSQILLSNGLDGLLYSLFKAFTEPGDEVITNDHSFVAFNKFAAMYNVKAIRVPNIDYGFDMDGLVECVSESTKIVYICNPNNPTGSIVSREDLQRTLAAIPNDILVIVDEAYFDYAKSIDPEFPDSIAFEMDNVLTLRTFSKLYGLAGIRIGYGIGGEKVISALKKVKLVFNPNSLAQVGAAAALDDLEHVSKTLKNNTFWINEIEAYLSEKGIRFIKSYANFVCSVFNNANEATEFFKFMDRNGVLLRKLDGFGMPEGVRISIGTNKEMSYFKDVLKRF